MQNLPQPNVVSAKLALATALAGSLGLSLCLAGCSSPITGSSSSGFSNSSSSSAQSTPVYMAPQVSGTDYNYGNSGTHAVVYSIDETNEAFQVTGYDTLSEGVPSQALFTGTVAAGERGLHTLATSVSYSYQYISSLFTYQWVPTSCNPSQQNCDGFAVELSGQGGGFVQLAGQPVVPVVNAAQCPDSGTHTYQFLTIPARLSVNSLYVNDSTAWYPATDTAYGSVDVSSSGSTVYFKNINQLTFEGGTPAQPSAATVTGTCGPTLFGNVTNMPGQLVTTTTINSIGVVTSTTPPQAMIGIGADDGLLVEDNGLNGLATMPETNPSLYYENVLGAGTGAVGLAKPSSPLAISTLLGEQYLGFIHGTGVFTLSSPTYPLGLKDQSSHLASFSYSSTSSNCASFAAQTGTLVNGIYGGDFVDASGNDNPSAFPSGYGNCNLAIDLGTPQDSSNSLYTNAKVWMGATYAANTTGSTYSFPAVAIAGQIGGTSGKYAIFVLGLDSTQPWAIYLLQSN